MGVIVAVCRSCSVQGTSMGILCDACAASLHTADDLQPGQVSTTTETDHGMWLVDRWGRLHPLSQQTTIGRRSASLRILHGSVSKQHAEIAHSDGVWSIRDLGSKNGVWLNATRITTRQVLTPGDRIRIGTVALLFLSAEAHGVPEDSDTTMAVAYSGPPTPVRLVEPTRGGGGFLLTDERRIRLSLLQYTLVELLLLRLNNEKSHSSEVQGYVPSIELLSQLPWSTAQPTPANLKQVVRRVRTLLEDTELALEGAHGMGYRLWYRADS